MRNINFLFLKEPIGANDVNVDNILVSNKYFFGKRCFKYFVGCVSSFSDDMKPFIQPFKVEESHQYILKKMKYEIKLKILFENILNIRTFMTLNTKQLKYTFENEAKTDFYDKISTRKYSRCIKLNNTY